MMKKQKGCSIDSLFFRGRESGEAEGVEFYPRYKYVLNYL